MSLIRGGGLAASISVLGCVHVDGRAAGSAVVEVVAQPDGRVDLREPPTVVHARGFWPGTMTSASEPGIWVTDERAGPVTHIELRNGCRLALDYVFAPNGDPGSASQAQRDLDPYTIQTQVIPSGHWLHLFEGDRWLAAAVVSVGHGVMDVSPDCETLEVTYEPRDDGTTTFAVHWQLDADVGDARPAARPALALTQELTDAPESWAAGEGQGIALRLANACGEPLDYAFVPTPAETPTRTSTLPARTERTVEVPPGWWLHHQVRAAGDETWRSGVTTDLAGGVVWLAANCIDHGVGDGRVVDPSGGGEDAD